MLVRPPARLRPVRRPELPIDVGQVELDRLFRHPEPSRKFLVRVAFRNEREDLAFAWSQRSTLALRGSVVRLASRSTGRRLDACQTTGTRLDRRRRSSGRTPAESSPP